MSWLLYIVAVVILVMSIMVGFSVGSATAVIPAATIGLQSPALKPVWDALVGGLRLFGILLFAFGFAIAILFACAGFVLGYLARLESRMLRLETTVASRTDGERALAPRQPSAQPAPRQLHG